MQNKNMISSKLLRWGAISGAISAICVVLVGAGVLSEKAAVRPYVDGRADTVFQKLHVPKEATINARVDKTNQQLRCSRELIARMYYQQRAMMTKEQERKAMDEMARDSMFKKFIEGE